MSLFHECVEHITNCLFEMIKQIIKVFTLSDLVVCFDLTRNIELVIDEPVIETNQSRAPPRSISNKAQWQYLYCMNIAIPIVDRYARKVFDGLICGIIINYIKSYFGL